LAYQAPNNGSLASHNHERLYTSRANVDGRRDWMARGNKGRNGYRKRVSPIRGAQALDFFNREL